MKAVAGAADLALEYLSRPEAPFLLRVAREFDRLHQATSHSGVPTHSD